MFSKKQAKRGGQEQAEFEPGKQAGNQCWSVSHYRTLTDPVIGQSPGRICSLDWLTSWRFADWWAWLPEREATGHRDPAGAADW